jgi:DNA modification methylase
MSKVKCDYHGVEHDLELVQRFAAKVGKGKVCPIAAAMETESGVYLLEPEYTITQKSPTDARWPQNIDLLITKLPSTDKDGYTQGLVGAIANKTYTGMNPNSLAFVIVSSYKEQKERPYLIVEVFKKAGFTFIDTIVWEKNKYTPTQGGKRLNNVYDFVFLFAKGENYHLDREAIAYLREGHEEYLCAGNVWRVKVDEKDSVPQELAEAIIKLSNLLPNSMIIDPFMDSGAVLKATLSLKHSFWGCEQNQLKYKRCKEAVRNAQLTKGNQ